MTESAAKYCRRCGAPITEDTDKCPSCGVLIPRHVVPEKQTVGESAIDEVKAGTAGSRFAPDTGLPDPSIAPNFRKAYKTAGEIYMQDAVGAILVSLLFALFLVVPYFLLQFSYIPYPYASMWGAIEIICLIIIMPAMIGLIGWGELRRLGRPAGVGKLISLTIKYFWYGIVWTFIILLANGLLIAAPAYGFQMLWDYVLPPATPYPTWEVFAVAVVVLIVVFSPIIMVFGGLSGWAIARGEPLQKSFGWALARLWRRFFSWWAKGFAITVILVVVSLICAFGLFFIPPWAAILWALLAGYTPADDADEVE